MSAAAFWARMGRAPWLDAYRWRTSRGVILTIENMPIKHLINAVRRLERAGAETLGLEWETASPAQQTRIRDCVQSWCPAYATMQRRLAGHHTLPPEEARKLAEFKNALPAAWQARFRARKTHEP